MGGKSGPSSSASSELAGISKIVNFGGEMMELIFGDERGSRKEWKDIQME